MIHKYMGKVKSFIKNHYYLFTGILYFMSFPSYDCAVFRFFPFFAWLCLVPLFISLNYKKTLRSVFFTSFITGLLGNFLAYNWIGDFGATVFGGSFVILLFLVPTLSVFFAVKILLGEYLARRYEHLRLFIIPSAWIIIDWIQSLGFLAFPWTYIGYSQYPFTSFIQSASVTGILGINFIIVLFNTTLAVFFMGACKNGFRSFHRFSWGRRFAAVMIILLSITAAGQIRLHKTSSKGRETLRVAIVQSCISPWENWPRNRFRYLRELKKYTLMAKKCNPDFVVWSESATLELLSFRYRRGTADRFDEELIDFIKKDVQVPLLTGEIGLIQADTVLGSRYLPQNSAVLFDGGGELVSDYAKIHLVPFGEWFPYAKWAPAIQKLALSFGGSTFVPGDRPELFEVAGRKLGTLICYEGIFYRLCRKYRNMGADFLVNITNDGWTDASNGHFQHFSASVLRAVENGVPLVRAGNTGVSALITPHGEITKTMPILKKGYICGEIPFYPSIRTFYSIYGDLILYIALAFSVFLFLSGFWRNKKSEMENS